MELITFVRASAATRTSAHTMFIILRCATSERHRKNGGGTSQTLLLFTINRKLHNCTIAHSQHILVSSIAIEKYFARAYSSPCASTNNRNNRNFHISILFIIFHLPWECLGKVFGCKRNPSSSLNQEWQQMARLRFAVDHSNWMCDPMREMEIMVKALCRSRKSICHK